MGESASGHERWGQRGEYAFSGEDAGGQGFGGGRFGVRRPLRFLAYKLELDDAQIGELAKILDDLKTERAQAAVDDRRALSAFAERSRRTSSMRPGPDAGAGPAQERRAPARRRHDGAGEAARPAAAGATGASCLPDSDRHARGLIRTIPGRGASGLAPFLYCARRVEIAQVIGRGGRLAELPEQRRHLAAVIRAVVGDDARASRRAGT
jgi:hypothetical protein